MGSRLELLMVSQPSNSKGWWIQNSDSSARSWTWWCIPWWHHIPPRPCGHRWNPRGLGAARWDLHVTMWPRMWSELPERKSLRFFWVNWVATLSADHPFHLQSSRGGWPLEWKGHFLLPSAFLLLQVVSCYFPCCMFPGQNVKSLLVKFVKSNSGPSKKCVVPKPSFQHELASE